MSSKPPLVGSIVWWIAVMFGLAEIITITIFHVAVSPEHWKGAFYLWMLTVLAAEFVFFAWTANYALASRVGRRSMGGAVLIQIHMLIVAWLVITGVMAVLASPATGGSINIGIAYAIITFLFLFGASALYLKNLAIQREERVTMPQRVELQMRVGDVEVLARDLRAWGAQNTPHLAAAERLAKKLDAVRTSLDFAPPGKRGTIEEGEAREVSDINAQIMVAAERLKTGLRELRGAPPDPDASLRSLDTLADELETLCRQRQQRLLIGG